MYASSYPSHTCESSRPVGPLGYKTIDGAALGIAVFFFSQVNTGFASMSRLPTDCPFANALAGTTSLGTFAPGSPVGDLAVYRAWPSVAGDAINFGPAFVSAMVILRDNAATA